MTNDQQRTEENQDQSTNQLLSQEEEKENKQRPLAFYLVLGLLILILLGGGIVGYLVYPFASKIEGSWISSDETMQLTSEGNTWELALPNYQQTEGLTIIYKGNWRAAGVNTYEGNQVKLLTEITKSKFSEAEISKLEKKSDLYTIYKQTDKVLTLQYTKKGIQEVQSISNLNKIMHLKLENIHWEKKQEKLFLNSKYFSKERIEFNYEK